MSWGGLRVFFGSVGGVKNVFNNVINKSVDEISELVETEGHKLHKGWVITRVKEELRRGLDR